MIERTARSLCIVILLSSSMCVWGDKLVYKCKDQQGTLAYQKTPCMDNVETVTAWIPVELNKPSASKPPTEDKNAKQQPVVLKLKQNVSGHYATEASINDKQLGFVVDTGASLISIPESIAHDAGIYCDNNKVGVDTANGISDACTAQIKVLKFGPFSLKDVSALIVPHLSQPLLGMNVLQLFKIAQEDGEMHISVQQKQ